MKKSLYLCLLLFLLSFPIKAQFLQGDTIVVNDTIVALDDITVTAQKNVIQKVDKIVYRINEKDFLRHAKADNALRRLPDVSVSTSGILIDSYKHAAIYIDGLPSDEETLKRIDIDEIERIEVIKNPSAIYGSELTGGVINVVKRKKKERFIKAELSGQGAAMRGIYGFTPSLAFKTGILTLNTYYSYTRNNQDVATRTERWTSSTFERQDIQDQIRGWQGFGQLNARLDFRETDYLILSATSMNYRFDHRYDGTLTTGETTAPVDDKALEQLGKYTANLLYRHDFDRATNLEVKGRYFDYDNHYRSLTDNHSRIREASGEILFQKQEIDLWGNPLELVLDYKSVYRRYLTGSQGDRLASQAIQSANATVSYNVAGLSAYLALGYDYTHQTVGTTTTGYHTLLPVATLAYGLPNRFNLSLQYARKITRPGVDYLNPTIDRINPMYLRQGNSALDPQQNNELSLSLRKSVTNNHNLSLNAYYRFNNGLISEILTDREGQTIYSYDNIGRARVAGVNAGWNASLPLNFYVNTQIGPSYNDYAAPGSTALLTRNSGWSLFAYAGIGTRILDFLSADLDLFYNSRGYGLTGTVRTRPSVNLNIEANLLSDRLTLGLYCMDLGGWSTRTTLLAQGDVLDQRTTIRNKMMNFSLSVTYRFGKKFNSAIGGRTIENSDIITK